MRSAALIMCGNVTAGWMALSQTKKAFSRKRPRRNDTVSAHLVRELLDAHSCRKTFLFFVHHATYSECENVMARRITVSQKKNTFSRKRLHAIDPVLAPLERVFFGARFCGETWPGFVRRAAHAKCEDVKKNILRVEESATPSERPPHPLKTEGAYHLVLKYNLKMLYSNCPEVFDMKLFSLSLSLSLFVSSYKTTKWRH